MDNYIREGWFSNESEVMCIALREFINHNRIELREKFLEDDIEWASKSKNIQIL